MNIGLLTSVRGQKKLGKYYQAILSHLQADGHDVVHNLDLTEVQLAPMSYPEREELFLGFYKRLLDCEVIIAECSLQSLQVGYGLSFLRDHGRAIIALYLKGEESELGVIKDLFSAVENIAIYEYEPGNISSTVDEALEYMAPHLDKRFTIIFPSGLLAKVEEVARAKKLPKAVYIRQLIEKDLSTANSL